MAFQPKPVNSLPIDLLCGDAVPITPKNINFWHLPEIHPLSDRNILILSPEFTRGKSSEELEAWRKLSLTNAKIQLGVYWAIVNHPEAVVTWENSFADGLRGVDPVTDSDHYAAVNAIRANFPYGPPKKLSDIDEPHRHAISYYGAALLLNAFPTENSFYRGMPSRSFWDGLKAQFPHSGVDFVSTRDHQAIICSQRAAGLVEGDFVTVFHVGGAAHNFTPYTGDYSNIKFKHYPVVPEKTYREAWEQYQQTVFYNPRHREHRELQEFKAYTNSVLQNFLKIGGTLILGLLVVAVIGYLFDCSKRRHPRLEHAGDERAAR